MEKGRCIHFHQEGCRDTKVRKCIYVRLWLVKVVLAKVCLRLLEVWEKENLYAVLCPIDDGWMGHSSCLESLYTLSLYDELSAAVEEGVGEHRLLDNASLLLPRNTAAAVFITIISS